MNTKKQKVRKKGVRWRVVNRVQDSRAISQPNELEVGKTPCQRAYPMDGQKNHQDLLPRVKERKKGWREEKKRNFLYIRIRIITLLGLRNYSRGSADEIYGDGLCYAPYTIQFGKIISVFLKGQIKFPIYFPNNLSNTMLRYNKFLNYPW